jgi:phenylalanyl-tRNA synthetase beta chain
MIVSYKWLQTYFKEKLPAPAKVAESFTFGAFEVEATDEVDGDTVFDLKVLPDRACYALSHRGIAYELSAIINQKSSIDFGGSESDISKAEISNDHKVSVTVADEKLCNRYCARYIKNIEVGASASWLKEPLEAVGQRSINTIVDATNFVMLDMGQPLHAFDADKVKGGIVVRLAKEREKIELLPEKGGVVLSRNIELQSTDLVIADDLGPIAIAGVKGGLRASVTDATKNLIIESANFDSVRVRKTSTRLGLRNEASKRFENGLALELSALAIEEVSVLISKLCSKCSVGKITDVLAKQKKSKTISVSTDFISNRLGVEIDAAVLEGILNRLQISFSKKAANHVLSVPAVRLDLVIPEDIVEEVGRIYGYNKIPPAIPKKASTAPSINQTSYWIEKIKDTMFGLGFSEVQTSSFSTSGKVEIQNPLASDKKFLRSILYENIQKCLEQNTRNASLLGLSEVKIFEIGTTFSGDEEKINFCLGVTVLKNLKKKDEYIAQIINKVFEEITEVTGLKINITKPLNQNDPIVDIFLSDYIPKFKKAADWDIKKTNQDNKYTPFSVYPFMVRDVAVFVPSDVTEKEVATVIHEVAGPLKVRQDLFDVFTKKFDNGDQKTSYAFHIVFQSYERTLVEEEINLIMKKVAEAFTAKGWQVR